MTLEKPGEQPRAIDPEGWVTKRKYAESDYDERLGLFLEEREDSVNWLRSLQSPDWDRAFEHRIFGPMTAKMFLTNWLAHDILHIRQIIRQQYLYLRERTSEDLQYAGKW